MILLYFGVIENNLPDMFLGWEEPEYATNSVDFFIQA